MVRHPSFFSENVIAQRIKSGRGQGQGAKYQPWLQIQDVPSDGRSHRIYSYKTKRVHHLLSDLELATFLMFDWSESVLDIREQFPLIRDDTRSIAQNEGIKHPSVRGVDQVMTTDFLIDAKEPFQKQFAVQVKYGESFRDERTIEKLDLERCYWRQKGIPWVAIIEQDIDIVIKKNIEWLYPGAFPFMCWRILSFRQITTILHHCAVALLLGTTLNNFSDTQFQRHEIEPSNPASG